MKHKYLRDIGVKENHMPWEWNKNDKRQRKWKKQRKKYGFDERETWSLDHTLYMLIYERLMMYYKISEKVIDIDTKRVKHKGEIFTQREIMDRILNGLKNAITYDSYNQADDDEDIIQSINDVFPLLKSIIDFLWW